MAWTVVNSVFTVVSILYSFNHYRATNSRLDRPAALGTSDACNGQAMLDTVSVSTGATKMRVMDVAPDKDWEDGATAFLFPLPDPETTAGPTNELWHNYAGKLRPASTSVLNERLEAAYLRAAGCHIKGSLGRPSLVLDVGGNIGWYSTLLAGAGCRVETFEPLPYNYNNLLKAVQLNPWLRERVHLNRVGVGTSTAETVINFVKGETGGSFITNPSLEHTNMYAANDQFSSGITKVPIHIERIDTLVEQNDLIFPTEEIAFMKIDVEGFEYHALRGAQRLLASHRILCIAMEISSHALSKVDAQGIRELFARTGYVSIRGPKCVYKCDFGWDSVLSTWNLTTRFEAVWFRPKNKPRGCHAED